MRRYLRLLGLFVRVSIQNDAAYRGAFIIQLGSSLAHVAAMLLGLWVIFANTDAVNGWGPWHMLALIGVFRLMSGVIALVIAPNMRLMMQDVRTGTLDFVLLKPVNAQFHASARRVVVWRAADVLLGLALCAVAAARLGQMPGVGATAAFLVLLAAGATIIYSLWLMLATTAFWLVRVNNIEMIFWNLFEAARYPIDIYGGYVRWTLTYVLPVAFVVTIPAQALVGDPRGGVAPVSTATLAGALIAAPLMLGLATLVWRVGVRRYSGASA